jgi:hypothetical protein
MRTILFVAANSISADSADAEKVYNASRRYWRSLDGSLSLDQDSAYYSLIATISEITGVSPNLILFWFELERKK